MPKENKRMDKLEVSGVYKILCLVNGKFYIGSSKNIYERWYTHRAPSAWDKRPNRPLYQDMRKYGVENFQIQILAPVEPEHLTQVEQEFIDMLKPAYNNNRANGWDVEKHKKAKKKWHQSEKGREAQKKASKKYDSQLCSYNGETLTLKALLRRFQRARIPHATLEAKKYLVTTTQQYS